VSATARMPNVTTGIQRTVRRLVGALKERSGSYPLLPCPVRLVPTEFRKLQLVQCPSFPQDEQPGLPVSIRENDVFLMLDSTWDFYAACARSVFPVVRQQNGMVVTGIYDILPITHPQFFPGPAVRQFRRWFSTAIATSDALLCVSKTTRSEVKAVLSKHTAALPLVVFQLGFDYRTHHSRIVRQDNPRPVFLVVGTIEPRKGHSVVLDAFEKIWQEGHDIELRFVGRPGWKTRFLMSRIKRLSRDQLRFKYLGGASDAVLSECYNEADAVILASYREGFGLPLIEAASYGKAIIASDIPIFREIGGSRPVFFKVGDSESRRRTILQFIKASRTTQPTTFRWLSWSESADMLIDVINELRAHPTVRI
jgi:glycosyltransferase involved in cell wall biosynthesis